MKNLLIKTTADAMRFNVGVGMATGIANGGDGLKEGGLAAGATYVSSKISNPIVSAFTGEIIQKIPMSPKLISEDNKEKQKER